MKYDFLIAGAGLTGATLARRLTDAGHRCLVLEARDHVAGNCHTRYHGDFLIHAYGPHCFHTNDERVWRWVRSFGRWKQFSLRVKAFVHGRGLLSLPVNLQTFYALWGVTTPNDARFMLAEKVAQEKVSATDSDAESFLLRTVGREIYGMFYRHYTEKQWGTHPRNLPSSIVSRLPVRFSLDDRYHADRYCALPEAGYTAVVERMLEGIDVKLKTPFSLADRRVAKQVIYTGAPDALYGCDRGKLAYRSLRFHHELFEVDDYQGAPVINYPDAAVPYTRVIEHKHLHGGPAGKTLVTFEHPASTGEPYYPIATQGNIALAKAYRKRAEVDGIICAGRLGTYRYLNMDGAIAAALKLADKL